MTTTSLLPGIAQNKMKTGRLEIAYLEVGNCLSCLLWSRDFLTKKSISSKISANSQYISILRKYIYRVK